MFGGSGDGFPILPNISACWWRLASVFPIILVDARLVGVCDYAHVVFALLAGLDTVRRS